MTDRFADEALVAVYDDIHVFEENVHLCDCIMPSNTIDIEGRWGFNEGAGTTAEDTSGNGNDGYITGATYIQGIDYHTDPGFSRYALRFSDTEGDYVNVTYSTDFDNAVPYTIELWFKPRTQTNATGTLVYQGSRYWIYYDDATSSLIMTYHTGAFLRTLSSGGGLTTGYTHIVCMYQDAPPTMTNMTMFFNGTLQNTSEEVGSPQAGSTHLFFGRDNGGTSYLSADLDVVRYYNRTLSRTEITENGIILAGDGYLYSENMLADLNATLVVNFKYNASVYPDGIICVKFSQDNATWVNAGGMSECEFLGNGTNTILLTGLDWSGRVYYRIQFNRTEGVYIIPTLYEVAVCYSTGDVGGWNILIIAALVASASVAAVVGGLREKKW